MRTGRAGSRCDLIGISRFPAAHHLDLSPPALQCLFSGVGLSLYGYRSSCRPRLLRSETFHERGEPPSGATMHETDLSVDLPASVSRNLRRLRTRRGHSLERLAKQSGVSRAMRGQIETGKSAPTISLLWKVANALNVPFASLLQTDIPRGAVVLRRTDAKILASSQGQFTSRALFPFEGDRREPPHPRRDSYRHEARPPSNRTASPRSASAAFQSPL